jgi:short-subunit dehydrogenase involved in D-alanine esterification of teichoic acids
MAQRVLITAGASGIGKEIAKAYAALGAKVCVCDIDAKALDMAAKEIPGLKTVVCDVQSATTLNAWSPLPSRRWAGWMCW